MPRTILFIMVDQLAAKWLEEAEAGVVDLPNLRELQRRGATFTRAFTNNPVCSPSRASIATGVMPAVHGLTECGYSLDPDVPTFMGALQEAGWGTAAFGKLHFQPQIAGVNPDYCKYGFDETAITEDARAGEWLDWVREQHPEHFEAAAATVWMTMIPELEAYGEHSEDLRSAILRARDRYPQVAQNAYTLPFPAEVSQTEWITGRAVEYLRRSGTRDVFAQVSYVQPHNPFTPPAEYLDRVNTNALPEPTPAAWRDDPIPYYSQARYDRLSTDTADWRLERHYYFADLAHLDDQLGVLMNTLLELGRLEESLILFTSDHGEMLHDQGLLGKWERHYDACIRIPLILAGEGIESGSREQLVDHLDIAPTILGWAQVPEPALPVRSADGLILTRALKGRDLREETSHERAGVLIQSNGSHHDPGLVSWARSVRTTSHRYTRHFAGGGEQLFDLDADPNEQHNLAEAPHAQGLRTELSSLLLELEVADARPQAATGLYQLGSW